MEELIKRLERVIQIGAPDKDGMHPISAETVLEVVKQLSEHGTNLAEVGTDCISRQAAIDALWKALFEYEDKTEKQFIERDDLDVGDWIGKYRGFVQNMSDIDRQVILNMPPAEPEHTCVNCGRTVNNGGWYADGRTRCPIEEHYALPKDGFCHLWEKRNVTDDDYPERRTDE